MRSNRYYQLRVLSADKELWFRLKEMFPQISTVTLLKLALSFALEFEEAFRAYVAEKIAKKD